MNWLCRLNPLPAIGRHLGLIWRGMLAAAPVSRWVMFFAPVPMTALVFWLVRILSDHSWPESERGHQISVLANIAYGALGTVYLVVIALTGLGVKFTASKDGITADVGDDDKPEPVRVTTTTTVEAPAPKPAETPAPASQGDQA